MRLVISAISSCAWSNAGLAIPSAARAHDAPRVTQRRLLADSVVRHAHSVRFACVGLPPSLGMISSEPLYVCPLSPFQPFEDADLALSVSSQDPLPIYVTAPATKPVPIVLPRRVAEPSSAEPGQELKVFVPVTTPRHLVGPPSKKRRQAEGPPIRPLTRYRSNLVAELSRLPIHRDYPPGGLSAPSPEGASHSGRDRCVRSCDAYRHGCGLTSGRHTVGCSPRIVTSPSSLSAMLDSITYRSHSDCRTSDFRFEAPRQYHSWPLDP